MTSVVITRPRHPLGGQTLRVLGRMRRHGRLELLAVLPDGSKSLIPAAWTDLDHSEDTDPAGQATTATLGSLTDLGHTVALVSALSARTAGEEVDEQAARLSPLKEDNRAAYPAQSDARNTRCRRHPRRFSASFPSSRSPRRSACWPA